MQLNLLKKYMLILSTLFLLNNVIAHAEINKNSANTSEKSIIDQTQANINTHTESSSIDDKIDGSRFILNCSDCHGFDGNSLNQEWPSIAGLSKQYIKRQLDDFKTGKRVNEVMTQIVREFPSSKELDSLAEYFSQQTMRNNNTPEIIKKHDLANLTIGEEIFTGKRIDYGIPACSACHGKDGMGDEEGKYPRLVGQNIDYIVKQMELFRSKKRNNDEPPQMRNIAQEMDDEDIASVAAYIAYMKLK